MRSGWREWWGLFSLLAIRSSLVQAGHADGQGDKSEKEGARPTLHGRFLHFTDMHPDKYYTPGSSVNDACHKSESLVEGEYTDDVIRKSRKKKRGDRVGHWGAPVR
jgi:hypothetical protein